MRELSIAAAVLTLLLGTPFAPAQDNLPERNFPSANGRHEKPIRVRRIYGIVTDLNGGVIRNAGVEVRRTDKGKVSEVTKGTTDYAGRFDMAATKGKYNVVFRMPGFKDETVPLEVSRKGWPGFKLTLTVAGIIDTVEVPRAAPQ